CLPESPLRGSLVMVCQTNISTVGSLTRFLQREVNSLSAGFNSLARHHQISAWHCLPESPLRGVNNMVCHLNFPIGTGRLISHVTAPRMKLATRLYEPR
ncbi:hypothetical protein KI387_014721, partial [Taxus chinensis]